MEKPPDAKSRDTTSINHDVIENYEKCVDTPAVATGHDNSSDLEKMDASLEKVEGQPSVNRVRTIKNGKVRQHLIIWQSKQCGKTNHFYSGCCFFFQSTQPLSFMAWIPLS
jgi:hypothetical protein